MRNQNGFTLTEAVVAMGVMSIGVIAITQMTTHSNRSIASARLSMEANNLEANVRFGLGMNSNCGCSFKAQNAQFQTSAGQLQNQVINLSELAVYSPDCATKGLVLAQVTNAAPSSGIWLKSIQVKDLSTVDNGATYWGSVVMNFEKPDGASVGGKVISRSFPVSLGVSTAGNTATVTDCKVSGSNAVGSQSQGGDLVFLQHNEGQCAALGGVLIDAGTSTAFCRFNSASCPAGWAQYLNWSTTSLGTGRYYDTQEIDQCGSSNRPCRRCSAVNGPFICTTTNHAWGNAPRESRSCSGRVLTNGCTATMYDCTSGSCYTSASTLSSTVTIFAALTQIGCY